MWRPDLFDHASTQASLVEEQRAYDIWTSHYPAYSIVETDKTRGAVIDALMTYENGLHAVVEVKSRRNLTRQKLEGAFGNRILLMSRKVANMRQVAKSLCTKLVVFYYLRDDDTLIVLQLQDENGELLAPLEYDVITVGGTHIDQDTHKQVCVYVDLTNAQWLTIKKEQHPDANPNAKVLP